MAVVVLALVVAMVVVLHRYWPGIMEGELRLLGRKEYRSKQGKEEYAC